ncbi:MAG TPA: hypothetical protein VGA50_02750 [Kiloniellales bacterium]
MHALRCAVLALAVSAWTQAASAVEVTEGGDFIFDISNPGDMLEVGKLSGITIKKDIPPRVGRIECARWARQFGVHPYQAVVSGTRPDRSLRVWICAGEVDNRALSEAYCKDMGMVYVRHDGSVVTCRFREQA